MNDQSHNQHGHRFTKVEKLRSPERLKLLEVDRVVDLVLDQTDAKTALDIGTGTGIFAEALNKRGLSTHGIDANPEMLAVARRFVPDAVFETSPAEHLPYADGTFEVTFMGLVLHETDDQSKAMSEAFRVTRQRLAVLEWPYEQQDFGPGLEERLKPDQVMQLATEAGFTGGVWVRLEHLVLYRFIKAEK